MNRKATHIEDGLDLHITVEGRVLSGNTGKLLGFSLETIAQDLEEHAAHYAYIATMAAMAKRRVSALKRELKTRKVQVYKAHRAQKAVTHFTEAMIDAYVDTDVSVLDLETAVDDATETYETLFALSDAYKQRREPMCVAAQLMLYTDSVTIKEAIGQSFGKGVKR